MRRLISMILTLILLALVGYNTWQVFLLRNEVAVLGSAVAAMKAGGTKLPSASDASSLMSKVRSHVEQANKYVLKGDFDRGKAEIEKSLKLIEQAGRDAGGTQLKVLEKLRDALGKQ